MKPNVYHRLEQSVVAWCRNSPDILAAIVIGSRGRQSPDFDDHSDLDLVLFCHDVAFYQQSHQWLNEFGELWIATLDFVAGRDPEWMAFLAPGVKVDFLLVTASARQSLADMLSALPYQQILTRGFRPIYVAEKVSRGQAFAATGPTRVKPASDRDFQQQINATLFAMERVVKFSLREDTWRSRYTFEAELKSRLLTLIEWHSHSAPGTVDDIWYEGRAMDAWADKRILDALRDIDTADFPGRWQVKLLTSLELLQLLGRETATPLGYAFPTEGQSQMIAWLKSTILVASD